MNIDKMHFTTSKVIKLQKLNVKLKETFQCWSLCTFIDKVSNPRIIFILSQILNDKTLIQCITGDNNSSIDV